MCVVIRTRNETMKNSEKRKKRKRLLDSLIKFLSFLGSSFALFTTFQKMQLPWKLYILVIAVFLILFISIAAIYAWENRKIKKQLEKKEDKLKRQWKKGGKKKKDQLYFVLRRSEANEVYKKHRQANRGKLISAIALTVAFVVFCGGQPENTKATIQWVKQFVNNEKTENQEVKDDDTIDQEIKENEEHFDESKCTDEKTEANGIKKQEGYNFVLKDSGRNLKLEKEIKNQIYFWGTDAEGTELEEIVIKKIKELRYATKRNADIYKISSKYGLDFDSLEEEEAEFKRKVEACRNLEYEADWIAVAPDSDELDDYIGGRRQLNSMKIDGIQGCYILCWRLANDYQYYALEYEAQTENAQAIYYYYSMSIYYCMEAMKYDITDSERAEAENYLLSRYEDLARADCIVDKEYKERAGEIAEILKNIL